MKLQIPLDLSNLGNTPDLVRYISQAMKQIVDIINGNISITDNLSAKILTVVFNAPNNEVGTNHSLGRVPVGYIPTNLSAGMIIYNGTSSNTTGIIYLKATAVGTVQVLIF